MGSQKEQLLRHLLAMAQELDVEGLKKLIGQVRILLPKTKKMVAFSSFEKAMGDKGYSSTQLTRLWAWAERTSKRASYTREGCRKVDVPLDFLLRIDSKPPMTTSKLWDDFQSWLLTIV